MKRSIAGTFHHFVFLTPASRLVKWGWPRASKSTAKESRPLVPYVAGTADAADHYAEHDQTDKHLDQFDEAIAERFELGGVFRKGQPADDAEHQSENHLEED